MWARKMQKQLSITEDAEKNKRIRLSSSESDAEMFAIQE